MNNVRRKEIKRIIAAIATAREDLDRVLEDEQDAYDNMPEGFQCSERGENMEEAIEVMEECMNSLNEVTDELEELL